MNSDLAQKSKPQSTVGKVSISTAEGYFANLNLILDRLSYDIINQISAILTQAYEQNRSVYVFGNGGSAALASHLACDLGKGIALNGRKRFRVLSLTDNVPLITAWANDSRYEDIFAEQLRNFVEKGDIVLAISGSGNSPNVINALGVAREKKAYVIGLTGYQGGKIKDLCDLCLIVPSDNMQFIEDLHVCICHAIFTAVRNQVADQENIGAVPTAFSARPHSAVSVFFQASDSRRV
jgi:D-sedoheptulose 7-phosphate isomerase